MRGDTGSGEVDSEVREDSRSWCATCGYTPIDAPRRRKITTGTLRCESQGTTVTRSAPKPFPNGIKLRLRTT